MREARPEPASGGRGGGHFLRSIRLDTAPHEGYPFDLPVVRHLQESGGLELSPGMNFLTGENGSGKSTLIEGVAVAAGLNAEGGSRSFRLATRPSHSTLGEHLVLRRAPGRERTSFFLRAESFYNVASEIERLDQGGPGLLQAYGGRSPHERSHGESFLDLMRHRLGPRGLYLMDEPEAALSPRGCLVALRLWHELVRAGCQLLVATHSPLLLALPGAAITEISAGGSYRRVAYDQAETVRLTREFLDAPDRTLRHLLADDG